MSEQILTESADSDKGFIAMDRSPEFIHAYYSFKARQGDTDNLLDILPNETYPDELTQMRANWWAVRDGRMVSDDLRVLKEDTDHFLQKVEKFHLRYLFPESKLRAYASGEYGQGVFGGMVPRGLRRLHLQNVRTLLQRHSNLQIGYTAREVGIYFAVNAAGGVAMGVESVRSLVVCAIVLDLEPAEIRCFRETFEKLWTAADAVTDRHRVMSFLQFLEKYYCS